MPRSTPHNEFVNNGTIRLDPQDSDASLDQDTGLGNNNNNNNNFIDDGPLQTGDTHPISRELYNQILKLDTKHRPIVQLYLPSHPNFSVTFVASPAGLMGEIKHGRMGSANRALLEEGLRLAYLDQEKEEKDNDLDRRILERQAEREKQEQEAKRRKILGGHVAFVTPPPPPSLSTAQPFNNYNYPQPYNTNNYTDPPPIMQPFNNTQQPIYSTQPPNNNTQQPTYSTQPPVEILCGSTWVRWGGCTLNQCQLVSMSANECRNRVYVARHCQNVVELFGKNQGAWERKEVV